MSVHYYWTFQVMRLKCILSQSWALAPQLFLNDCADSCAASFFAFLSAIEIQIRLGLIIFQSTVIKV